MALEERGKELADLQKTIVDHRGLNADLIRLKSKIRSKEAELLELLAEKERIEGEVTSKRREMGTAAAAVRADVVEG